MELGYSYNWLKVNFLRAYFRVTKGLIRIRQQFPSQSQIIWLKTKLQPLIKLKISRLVKRYLRYHIWSWNKIRDPKSKIGRSWDRENSRRLNVSFLDECAEIHFWFSRNISVWISSATSTSALHSTFPTQKYTKHQTNTKSNPTSSTSKQCNWLEIGDVIGATCRYCWSDVTKGESYIITN